jgi:hypothetical protein
MGDSIQPPVHENTCVSPGIFIPPPDGPPCPKTRMSSFFLFPET